MSPPKRRWAGGAATDDAPPATTTSEPQRAPSSQPGPGERNTGSRQGVLIAPGFISPAIGRRHLALVVIPRCPACSYVHVHRSNAVNVVGKRTGSCGATYIVRIAGSKRGRWSA